MLEKVEYKFNVGLLIGYYNTLREAEALGDEKLFLSSAEKMIECGEKALDLSEKIGKEKLCDDEIQNIQKLLKLVKSVRDLNDLRGIVEKYF